MKVKTWMLAVLTLAILLGGVALSSALGYWKTTNDKTPAVIKTGDFAGQADPRDIRGSYRFADIAKSFGIPLEDLGEAFALKDPAGYADFKCKDLESLYGELEGVAVGTESVRYFVALYLGIPVLDQEASYLPRQAIDILAEKANLTKEQLGELEQYAVDLP